uniref:Uncharacterized protein n=1 Tax=Arundo donax TaxID=35708 RepID=A0A0A9GXT4_ARUDO
MSSTYCRFGSLGNALICCSLFSTNLLISANLPNTDPAVGLLFGSVSTQFNPSSMHRSTCRSCPSSNDGYFDSMYDFSVQCLRTLSIRNFEEIS